MFEREIGYTAVDVRKYGARGNGVQDDTYAIQCAIDALPSDGGTVVVPEGTYPVDPLKGLNMRSHVALKWMDGAKFLALPNDAERDTVIMMRNIDHSELINPVIIGNREDGLGTSGEWGHGVAIRGARNVTVRGGLVSKCWGDGISIGSDVLLPAKDIVICEGFTAHGNRRNGLTIGRSDGVTVIDSVFSNTFGTDPQAGIDVEPDSPGSALNFRIERCRVFGNAKTGILVWQRTEPELFIKNGEIFDNDIFDNGQGIWTFGADTLRIMYNRIRDNRSHGILIDRGCDDVQVRNNWFRNNFKSRDIPARNEVVMAGDPPGDRDIYVRGATNMVYGSNTYEAQTATKAPLAAV